MTIVKDTSTESFSLHLNPTHDHPPRTVLNPANGVIEIIDRKCEKFSHTLTINKTYVVYGNHMHVTLHEVCVREIEFFLECILGLY